MKKSLVWLFFGGIVVPLRCLCFVVSFGNGDEHLATLASPVSSVTAGTGTKWALQRRGCCMEKKHGKETNDDEC